MTTEAPSTGTARRAAQCIDTLHDQHAAGAAPNPADVLAAFAAVYAVDRDGVTDDQVREHLRLRP